MRLVAHCYLNVVVISRIFNVFDQRRQMYRAVQFIQASTGACKNKHIISNLCLCTISMSENLPQCKQLNDSFFSATKKPVTISMSQLVSNSIIVGRIKHDIRSKSRQIAHFHRVKVGCSSWVRIPPTTVGNFFCGGVKLESPLLVFVLGVSAISGIRLG